MFDHASCIHGRQGFKGQTKTFFFLIDLDGTLVSTAHLDNLLQSYRRKIKSFNRIPDDRACGPARCYSVTASFINLIALP
jgi:hypothetical protein